jgi:homoserine kinase
MSKKVSVHVPATSANLGPGFDVLGLALALYNEVHLETESGHFSSFRHSPPTTVVVEGEGSHFLPRDSSNLIVQAVHKVFEKAKRWPKDPLKIRTVNRIPLTRGLGSSSAAIVGGLCAANALTGGRLPLSVLIEIAVGMEGHPDNVVPAFVGGLCVAGVVKEETRFLRFNAPPNLSAVVCSPDRPLETRDARRVLPSRIPFTAAVFTSSRVAFLLGAMLQKRYDWLEFAMDDVLHQPARARLIPGLRDAIAEAKKAGAYGAALSGAGSSVIALVKPGAVGKKVGAAMQKAFAARNVASRSQELALENKGIRYR